MNSGAFSATSAARATPFDNSTNGFISTNVQAAIEEVKAFFTNPSTDQNYYVSKGGSDTTGNGSIGAPYLTIGQALTVITDSSPTKRYVINVDPGDYPENLVLKANVFIKGSGPITTRITGTTININDATWNVASADNRSGFQDISVNAVATWDFTSQTNNTDGKMYFFNIRTGAAWTFTANNAINQAIFQDSQIFGNTTFNGMEGFASSCTWESGNITLNSSAAAGIPASLILVGGGTLGNMAATWTSQQPVTLTLMGFSISSTTTLTASGASCSVVASHDSLPVPASRTFSASAVLTRVGDNFASGVLSATTNVDCSAATAPTAGQSLVATSGTVAAWGSAVKLTAQEVNFSANITTTSTTDVVLTGMTITPAAGTYLIWFSTWLTHSNGNDTVTISIYAGGVQTASTIRTTVPFSGAVGAANNGISHATNGLVTVNGSQAIAIEWHTNAGTATAHAGNMDILRVA